MLLFNFALLFSCGGFPPLVASQEINIDLELWESYNDGGWKHLWKRKYTIAERRFNNANDLLAKQSGSADLSVQRGKTAAGRAWVEYYQTAAKVHKGRKGVCLP